MNKYRKAEARLVKVLVQACEESGYAVSYRRTRRMLRKFAKACKSLPKLISRGFSKGLRRVDYYASEAVKNMAQFGTQASIYLIDETPIEDTPTLWPKENPEFEKRYLGKFNIEKENADVD